ncbi:MAG: polysaccharide deacetylase family protein [Leptolyngbyaceae cyanobacterium bins.59]|nr:polysaccharide deacetylase family protein [Leptolyngbyaceae cyanobacterium bins.59]
MLVASFLPAVARVLQTLFPDCLWALDPKVAISPTTGSPQIALTFDDGPHPVYTPQLLSILERYQVQASFFWLGACVDRNPTIARAVYEAGHWIGLHGYDHQSFPLLSPSDVQAQLEQTRTSIVQACQIDAGWLRDVRPPNGLFTPNTLRHLRQGGYRPVMWSVVPIDWTCPGPAVVVDRVLRQTKAGSHIVLHDGAYGGRDVAQVVDRLVPTLLAKNFEFVTIAKFWQLKHNQ